jgi:hypothetical protein
VGNCSFLKFIHNSANGIHIFIEIDISRSGYQHKADGCLQTQ